MPERVGRVVEFLDADKLKFGVVTAESGGKLHLTDRGGRQHKVTGKQVVVVHAVSAGPVDVAARAEEIDGEVNALRADVDTELLWDDVEDSSDAISLAGLAESWFAESSGAHQSAVFRAVSEDGIRFRLRGAAVFKRREREVNDQLNAQRNREEKESQRLAALEWLGQTICAEESVEVTAAMEDLLRRVEDWVWRPSQRSEELADWLRRAAGNLSAEEAAFRVLRQTGRLPEDADPFLVAAGIRQPFPLVVASACEALTPFIEDSRRVDFRPQVCFSIDDEETLEVDDALTVELTPNGTRVGIHIADVASFVEADGELDREAFRRGVSIYLPSRSVTMFPHRLSRDLASLKEGETRPTMSFVLLFDSAGKIAEQRIERGVIRVTHRLDYDGVDAILRSRDDAAFAPPFDRELVASLRRLDELTTARLAARRARGALTIRRPELRVQSRPGRALKLEVLLGDSPGRRLIAELMILANAVAAEHARRLEIPFIYRTQDPPREPVEVPDEYDPVRLEGVFRSLERSAFSTHARPHSGLGLDAYTQTTSPIRRFADLVMQRQLAASLEGREPPYVAEELLRVLSAAQDVEREARDVETRAVRARVIEYLESERREDELEVVVVRRQGAGAVVETRDLYIRGTLMSAGEYSPGDSVSVRIDRIDPGKDILIFRPVEPAASKE